MIKEKLTAFGAGFVVVVLTAVFALFVTSDIRLIYVLAGVLLLAAGCWIGANQKHAWLTAGLLFLPIAAGFALTIMQQLPTLWPALVLWLGLILFGLNWRNRPTNSVVRFLSGGLLVALSWWYCVFYVPERVTSSLAHFSNVAAPSFQLEPMGDSGTDAPSGLTPGKVLVIDFLATWCGPCISELPELNKARIELRDRSDIEFVVVGTDAAGDTPEKLQAFAQRHQIAIPLAFDRGGKAQKDFNLTGYPSLAVIDRAGRIRLTHQGYNRSETNFRRDLVQFLKSL